LGRETIENHPLQPDRRGECRRQPNELLARIFRQHPPGNADRGAAAQEPAAVGEMRYTFDAQRAEHRPRQAIPGRAAAKCQDMRQRPQGLLKGFLQKQRPRVAHRQTEEGTDDQRQRRPRRRLLDATHALDYRHDDGSRSERW
jgi:hypothetical protein